MVAERVEIIMQVKVVYRVSLRSIGTGGRCLKMKAMFVLNRIVGVLFDMPILDNPR